MCERLDAAFKNHTESSQSEVDCSIFFLESKIPRQLFTTKNVFSLTACTAIKLENKTHIHTLMIQVHEYSITRANNHTKRQLHKQRALP